MKVECLASSSAGNCYILQFENEGVSTQIMIEAGIPYKEILAKCNKAGIDLSQTECCLVTHAHSDHCKSAKDLANHGIKVFASKYTLEKANCRGVELSNLKKIKVAQNAYLMPFEVYHDIEGALGFIIKTPKDVILFVNDCKYWKENLINFKPTAVFIECNFIDKIVYAQYGSLKKDINSGMLNDKELKEAKIKLSQHRRNIDAHMSLSSCIKNLKKLNLKHCQAIFLMHMSDRFTNEYEMKNEVKMATGIQTYACGKKGGIK